MWKQLQKSSASEFKETPTHQRDFKLTSNETFIMGNSPIITNSLTSVVGIVDFIIRPPVEIPQKISVGTGRELPVNPSRASWDDCSKYSWSLL